MTNRKEFEAAMAANGFQIVPSNNYVLAGTYAMLSPEDFMKISANFKKKVLCYRTQSGGATYYAADDTLSAYTMVKDATPTGAQMEYGGVRTYFDQHPDQRIILKQACIVAIGLAIWTATYFVAKVPIEFSPMYVGILNLLNEKYKLLTPFEPWPLIGASV